MTLYLCYYLRLNDKIYRYDLAKKLEIFFEKNSFLAFPEKEVEKFVENIFIEKGIGLNSILKENLFASYICIENNVPLIISGKPGIGKNLCLKILFDNLKGENAENDFFKKKRKLYRYCYHGNEKSELEEIEKIYRSTNCITRSSEKKNMNLIFIEEIGLLEKSNNNSLQIIKLLIENDSDNNLSFIGTSIERINPAKINFALNISNVNYDIQDLENTAISIASGLDSNLSFKYKEFLNVLAKIYHEYIKYANSAIKFKDFHNNIDFYYLIKTAMNEIIAKNKELNIINENDKKILTEIGTQALIRNFSGLEESNLKILEIYKYINKNNFDNSFNINKSFSVLNAIEKNITEPNTRCLMLITEGNDEIDIVKYFIKKLNKKYIELIGNPNDVNYEKYIENILTKIKFIIKTDSILILKNLDVLYPYLSNLFKKNYFINGEKKFTKIEFKYDKSFIEVNKDFHIIIAVNKNQIEKLFLEKPYLNRFEKHLINLNKLLEQKDLEINKKIAIYLELISNFNDRKDIKLGKDDESSNLIKFNEKYKKKPLTDEEKQFLEKLSKIDSVKAYKEIIYSLRILMKEIINENYDKDLLIYDVIEKLSKNIILNKEFVDLLKRGKDYFMDEKVFTINNSMSIFEYFEDLFWPLISNNIPEEYKLKLSDEVKIYIINYFNKINNNERTKIINAQNFKYAVRKLITRYLIESNKEICLESNIELKFIIGKKEFWNEEINNNNNNEKYNELLIICHKDIKIENIWDLYNLLDKVDIINTNKKNNENEREEDDKDLNYLDDEELGKRNNLQFI